MVLIHFHLKHPVMIGRKKSSDIQFFTEVSIKNHFVSLPFPRSGR